MYDDHLLKTGVLVEWSSAIRRTKQALEYMERAPHTTPQTSVCGNSDMTRTRATYNDLKFAMEQLKDAIGNLEHILDQNDL